MTWTNIIQHFDQKKKYGRNRTLDTKEDVELQKYFKKKGWIKIDGEVRE